eukprot:gene7327-5163_t
MLLQKNSWKRIYAPAPFISYTKTELLQRTDTPSPSSPFYPFPCLQPGALFARLKTKENTSTSECRDESIAARSFEGLSALLLCLPSLPCSHRVVPASPGRAAGVMINEIGHSLGAMSGNRHSTPHAPGSPSGVYPNASPAPPRVYVGMRLNRWLILSRIGAGSFGEAFAAIDFADVANVTALEPDATPEEIAAWLNTLPPPEERREVCVKVEQENKNVLRLEALALKRVQACAQVVRYLGSGCTGGMHFLVMEKLGPNLADLRRRSMHGTFNIYTTLKAGISCLQAIREVHERGLIHRDIKPSNFITGIPGTPEHATCFLIDFGLARRYRRSTGELREAREHAGFRGTSRYASVASHRHTELGRVDDLWSLLFMLIEFATGTLPWRRYKVKEDIGLCKERSIGPRLVRNLPREFRLFLTHLQSLRYEDEPDYELLLSCLHRAVERRGYPPDKLLDWQLDPEEQEAAEQDSRERHALAEDPDGADGADEPASPGNDRPPSAVRVSEVDISCPQTGRAEEGNTVEPTGAAAAGADGNSPLEPDDAFSPREAPTSTRHLAAASAPEPQEVLLDDMAGAKPYDNGTTNMDVPKPPVVEPKEEKEKSKCNCLVM